MHDDRHDKPSRAGAWYYLRHKGQPITGSRHRREGVALAYGRYAAGQMKKHLIEKGRAPERGTRLVACGFDGQPELGDFLEDRRSAGDRCWLEYAPRERGQFRVYKFEEARR